MESSKKSGHDDNFRRTWNKADYVPKPKPKLSKTKNEFSKEDIAKKEKLKVRNYLLNLDKKVGKTTLLQKTTSAAGDGGYFCDVCQCAINDSINFLDHVNGIKHQKNLGMSMKIERSSLDQVKSRIQEVKKQKEESEKKKELTFEERVQKAKEMEIEKKKRKKEAKFRKKSEERKAQEQDIDQDMLKVMGFGAFSGK